MATSLRCCRPSRAAERHRRSAGVARSRAGATTDIGSRAVAWSCGCAARRQYQRRADLVRRAAGCLGSGGRDLRVCRHGDCDARSLASSGRPPRIAQRRCRMRCAVAACELPRTCRSARRRTGIRSSPRYASGGRRGGRGDRGEPAGGHCLASTALDWPSPSSQRSKSGASGGFGGPSAPSSRSGPDEPSSIGGRWGAPAGAGAGTMADVHVAAGRHCGCVRRRSCPLLTRRGARAGVRSRGVRRRCPSECSRPAAGPAGPACRRRSGGNRHFRPDRLERAAVRS